MATRVLSYIAVILLAAQTLGCGLVSYEAQPWSLLPPATGPFDEPSPLRLEVGAADADDPTLPADLLEIYFEMDRDIWVAKRTHASSPFGPPSIDEELSVGVQDTNPEISSDGLTIYISRAGTTYEHSRPDRSMPWGPTTALTQLSTGSSDAGLTINEDQTYAVVHDNSELFAYRRESSDLAWGTRFPLVELDVGDGSNNAFLSPSGLQLFFELNDNGDGEIYHSTRDTLDDAWQPPVPLDVNTNADEGDPWLSPRLDYLVFWRRVDGSLTFYGASR